MHSTKEPVYPDPRLWTCIYELFLKAHWGNMLPTEVAKMLGRKVGSCSQRAKFIGLKVNRRRIWTTDAINFVKKNYKTTGNSELAEELNKIYPRKDGILWHPHKHVRSLLTRLGVERTNEQLNAIRKRNEKAGRYDSSKGENNHNYKPIGTIAVIRNKTCDGARNKLDAYFIKTEKGWEQYKVYLWEQANGPLPKGHRIWFIDGNVHNVVLENLKLVSTTHAMRDHNNKLTDKYIASKIARGNAEFKKFILEKGQSIIEVKRSIMEVKRANKWKR